MKQIINLGSGVGAHNGDGARTGGQKINDNFTELYGFSEVMFNELTNLEDTKLAIANNLSDLDDASTARTNLGIGNIDNTSDANKPVSTAQATADATVLSSANSYTDSKVASVYKLKGSVANYAALPSSGRIVGDVWNLVDTGANYVWTGTVWDELGTTVDISVKANLASPTFTGTPSLPTGTIGVTQTAGTNNTTLATTAFATTALNGKMNNPSLTASYIPKALTATTIGNSRLADTGSFITIDNKLSLAYQDIQLNSLKAQSIIGGGYSNQSLTGSDLVIAATSIPNYQTTNVGFKLNTGINPSCVASSIYSDNVYIASGSTMYKLNRATGVFEVYASGLTTANGIWTITESPAGDVYYVASWSKAIYKQTLGVGAFSLYATISTTSLYGVGITVTPNNHIYVCTFGNGGKIFKQTSSTGPFVDLLEPSQDYISICCDSNNNVYTAVGSNNSLGGNNGYIYKQTGSTGAFAQLDTILSSWTGLTWDRVSSNLYANNYSGIYKYSGGTGTGVYQGYNLSNGFVGPIAAYKSSILLTWINGAGGFQDVYLWNMNEVGSSDVSGGTLKLNAGTGKGTGSSDIEMWTGQVLASGTTMQTVTLRAKINNTGLMTLPSVTNALIEADTTGKAVVTKEYANNRLVVETTSGYTLTNADSGGIVIFKTTAAQTLTIPTGLADGFECTFVTLSGVTLTVVSTGNTLNNATSTTLLPQLSFTLKRMLATNTYITAGSL